MGGSGHSPGDGARPSTATEDEFHEALQRLVTAAVANDVDVRGGWPIDDDGRGDAWELEITRIAQRTTARVADAESPALAVVDAVAAREDADPTDLPPLYDSVGPGVLELLQSSDDRDQHVRFDYCGYAITVTSGGAIKIDG